MMTARCNTKCILRGAIYPYETLLGLVFVSMAYSRELEAVLNLNWHLGIKSVDFESWVPSLVRVC